MTSAIPPAPADFGSAHRDMLERWAAGGCAVSRYMLDHKVYFPEAIEALHRERCREPAPVPDEETIIEGEEGR